METEITDADRNSPMFPIYALWVAAMEANIPEFRERQRYERLLRWGSATRQTFGVLWEIPTGPRLKRPSRRTQ